MSANPGEAQFGIVAGWLDVSGAALEAMGWGAKLTKNPHFVEGHFTSEKLWVAGHEIGERARTNLAAHHPYKFDERQLASALELTHARNDCRACKEPPTGAVFKDFSMLKMGRS